MGFAHNIEFDITGDRNKEELERFLEQVPPTGVLETVVHHNAGDRPWESPSIKVILRARWITE